MAERNKGCVYLVGAGCGQADLITVRGLKLLRRCDAVVYDDLIAEKLLREVPPQAQKLYMGKREGKHSSTQQEISDTLVALASGGNMVVRLKGGDPFVFGRGGEEILALKEAGISFEEIPGITSAIAIPAEAGIPVTHRSVSRSVHIVTARTADTPERLPEDFDRLAAADGTLVFLMGLKQLRHIADRLVAAGRDPQTEAAVVSGGNAIRKICVRGTLADIAEKTQEAHVLPPAVIVVGKTAGMDFSGTIPRPLAGISVGITGTDEFTEKLEAELEELGADVFTAVRSVIKKRPADFPFENLCGGKPHWLVFTSGNGVRIFFEELREQKIDIRRLWACKFAAIGAATEKKLEEYGIFGALCPETYTGKELGKLLLRRAAAGEDMFLFRSAQGSGYLYEMLAEQFPVTDVALYDVSAENQADTGNDLQAGSAARRIQTADYLTFASSGGVRQFLQLYGAIPEHAVCVTIGAVTSGTLRECCQKPFLEAAEISAHGMAEAILSHIKRNYLL